MLVLPGPGWAAIFVGLAVLGTEFVWAQRLLDWARRQAAAAVSHALGPNTRRRRLLLATAAIAVLATALAAGLYLWR